MTDGRRPPRPIPTLRYPYQPHPCVLQNIQGAFLTVPTQKFLSVRLHSKSHQKSSKCQNLLTGWHLEESC